MWALGQKRPVASQRPFVTLNLWSKKATIPKCSLREVFSPLYFSHCFACIDLVVSACRKHMCACISF